ncbi:Glycosyl hydrolase family [Trichinella spiralis]|uniref:Glycosyl hydrolase family n=1 Tax=Trichinella spiralis TaxID=6334 RepID=A0ABR3KHU8_TRISP
MSFMHCIFVVLFFAVGEAQILGETTHYGRNDPVMLRNAHEALFSSDLKQESGVFHKLLELEESSTMGILTTMKVVMQDTDCPVSFALLSYYDVLVNCQGEGRRKHCTMEYTHRNPSKATVSKCFEEVEEPLIIPQRVKMIGGRAVYIDSNADVEEQMQMLGETTHYDSKEQSGVLHKLVELEESSTMGILTTMKVVIQDTECRVSSAYSSYYDVLHYCHGKGPRKHCTLEYRHRTPSTATVSECFEEVEEPLIVPQRVQRVNGRTIYLDSSDDVEEQVVSQRSQLLGGTTKYTDSNVHIKEEVKQAIFESDKKKSSGTYLLLDKIVEGFNMGISSRFQVLVKETECDIKEKAFNSYEDVYKNCSGSGDSKVCSVEYKYFDPTKSTVEC